MWIILQHKQQQHLFHKDYCGQSLRRGDQPRCGFKLDGIDIVHYAQMVPLFLVNHDRIKFNIE